MRDSNAIFTLNLSIIIIIMMDNKKNFYKQSSIIIRYIIYSTLQHRVAIDIASELPQEKTFLCIIIIIVVLHFFGTASEYQ